MRLLFTSLLVAVTSCSSSTGLRVQITGAGSVMLGSATVSIFDPNGIIGKKQLEMPVLPGQVIVAGLPNQAVQLRIVVDATTNSVPIWGGTEIAIVPHQLVTATVSLDSPPDGDRDGIPDALDDCPTVADPTQANSAGAGPGDACRGARGDLGVTATGDLSMGATAANDDLARAPAMNDLASAPPDLAPAPSLCASAGAIFCDGFEAGALAAPWGVFLVGGSVAVDNTHVFRGQFALHVHQNAVASGSSATGVAISTQPYPTPDIYLRAYVYLPSPAPTGTFTFLRAQQSANGQFSLDLDVSNNQFFTFASRTGIGETSATAPPLDRWFCVEWRLHLATTGYTTVAVDGNAVSGLQAANTFDTTNSPTYDWLVIGLDSGSAELGIPARDLWLDEIVLDNKAIGCAR